MKKSFSNRLFRSSSPFRRLSHGIKILRTQNQSISLLFSVHLNRKTDPAQISIFHIAMLIKNTLWYPNDSTYEGLFSPQTDDFLFSFRRFHLFPTLHVCFHRKPLSHVYIWHAWYIFNNCSHSVIIPWAQKLECITKYSMCITSSICKAISIRCNF